MSWTGVVDSPRLEFGAITRTNALLALLMGVAWAWLGTADLAVTRICCMHE